MPPIAPTRTPAASGGVTVQGLPAPVTLAGAEPANDTLLGEAGDDVLLGGPGQDVLDGVIGNNVVIQD